MNRDEILRMLNNEDADDILKWTNTVQGDQLRETAIILAMVACDAGARHYLRIMALNALRSSFHGADHASHQKFWSSKAATVIVTQLLDHAGRMFVTRNGKEIHPGCEELLNHLVTTGYLVSYRIEVYRKPD